MLHFHRVVFVWLDIPHQLRHDGNEMRKYNSSNFPASSTTHRTTIHQQHSSSTTTRVDSSDQVRGPQPFKQVSALDCQFFLEQNPAVHADFENVQILTTPLHIVLYPEQNQQTRRQHTQQHNPHAYTTESSNTIYTGILGGSPSGKRQERHGRQ